MNEAKKEKLRQKLIKAGLIHQNDTLIDCLQVSYKENLLGKIKSSWKSGWIYFTQEKIVCTTSFLDSNIVIPYTTIKRLERNTQFFLFPFGIDVTYEEAGTGKMIVQKFSVQKRNYWIDFLAQKAGISVG